MDDRLMTLIRTAINEPTESVFDDDEVEQTWLVLNKNTKMTIAHFFFAKAQNITFTTMPTAPTLDTTPIDGYQIWVQKSRNEIEEFNAELAEAKGENDSSRIQVDILREQGNLWQKSAELGDLI